MNLSRARTLMHDSETVITGNGYLRKLEIYTFILSYLNNGFECDLESTILHVCHCYKSMISANLRQLGLLPTSFESSSAVVGSFDHTSVSNQKAYCSKLKRNVSLVNSLLFMFTLEELSEESEFHTGMTQIIAFRKLHGFP